MTKSTITRERIQRIIRAIDSEAYDEEEIREWLSSDEIMELSRMALAAMDSESGCLPLDYLQGHKDGLEWAAQLAEANHPETGDWLYDDPIELAKAIRKGPDMPPAQPVLDTEPVAYTDERNLGYIDRGRETAYLWGNQNSEASDVALYRHAQPAPVVPEEWTIADAVKFCKETGRQDAGAAMDAWNACRAAMLQASPVCTYPSGDSSLHWPCPVHPGNSPAQSDCCPAQNSVNPAQGGNYLVIPDEMTSEQAYEIGYYYGDPVDVFARGANWMRQHIIDSTLAAGQQSPGSEPATVPGKWIPATARLPEDRKQVILWDAEIGEVKSGHYSHKTHTFYHCGDAIQNEITHWMLPPSAPQEVK